MAIADFKERSPGVDRDEKRRAGNEFLVVEIAGMNPWRRAIDRAHRPRWRDAHAAKEWTQRDLHAVGELAHHSRRVEANDLRAAVREILRQESAASAERVARIGHHEVDALDANLEHVAGIGALHEHGSGE